MNIGEIMKIKVVDLDLGEYKLVPDFERPNHYVVAIF